jgi:hypothetical protein
LDHWTTIFSVAVDEFLLIIPPLSVAVLYVTTRDQNTCPKQPLPRAKNKWPTSQNILRSRCRTS